MKPDPRSLPGRSLDSAFVTSVPAGLCDQCRHQRVVSNTRGSHFSLCQRSAADPTYPRYPSLPVLTCVGFERTAEEQGSRERQDD